MRKASSIIPSFSFSSSFHPSPFHLPSILLLLMFLLLLLFFPSFSFYPSPSASPPPPPPPPSHLLSFSFSFTKFGVALPQTDAVNALGPPWTHSSRLRNRGQLWDGSCLCSFTLCTSYKGPRVGLGNHSGLSHLLARRSALEASPEALADAQ